ncbi:PepSY-associated TM helix domain-containing protein [Acetobacter cibinongensis]|nr:PepSY-associated TM helix domain-containing protein [Acetobacter cibinongensis]
MKINTSLVLLYKEIHTWVGIVCGLFLFIAFYAGAITMFSPAIDQWVQNDFLHPAPMQDTPALLTKIQEQRSDLLKNYTLTLMDADGSKSAFIGYAGGHGRKNEGASAFTAFLDDTNTLQVQKINPAHTGEIINKIHQTIGLPFNHTVSEFIMGWVALLYGLALITGLIIFLPGLKKNLFAVRVGTNKKKMWLDIHNVLGVFSLPFHLIIALTSVTFAFHDVFYAAQDALFYHHDLNKTFASARPPATPTSKTEHVLSPPELLNALKAQAPNFQPTSVSAQAGPHGSLITQVHGMDLHHPMRSLAGGFVTLDAYTGAITQKDYMPGLQPTSSALLTSFFALHFGSFGGTAMLWAYFVLGASGAFIFYSGNILWLETRRKKGTQAAQTPPKLSHKILSSLTVGVTSGCIAGISAIVLAARWLSHYNQSPDVSSVILYYSVFSLCVAWAFIRKPHYASWHLLGFCGLITLGIPLSNLWAIYGTQLSATPVTGTTEQLIDLIAALAACSFLFMAYKIRQKALKASQI